MIKLKWKCEHKSLKKKFFEKHSLKYVKESKAFIASNVHKT